jgi:biotin carboxylase
MTNKAAMRERLASHGVPQPRFAVASAGNAGTVLERIGPPAVLKPVDSGGQRGLHKLESARELARVLPNALEHSRTGTVLLEQFVEGSELNGIAVVRDGAISVLTLSDRLRPPGRGFGVGWIHLFPSELPDAVLTRARDVVIAAIKALGLENGIAFPQVLATADGEVLVVEVAARIAAGQMADLVRLGIGVDLLQIAFAQALGQPVPAAMVAARFERPIAIRFLTASPGLLPTGDVVSISGLEQVRAARNVLAAGLYIEIGETIRPVQVDADRRGYVIATGRDQRAALAAANAASRKLAVTTNVPNLLGWAEQRQRGRTRSG